MRGLAAALLLCAAAAPAFAADAPLRFRATEGDVLNAFHQEGASTGHLLLSSGTTPRVLAAFPAGNSGVGVWFADAAAPVAWTLAGTTAATRADAEGRPLHGIAAEATVTGGPLAVRDVVVGSVRVLRDVQLSAPIPGGMRAAPRIDGRTVTWARDRIDGAPGYAIAIEVVDGDLQGGTGDRPVVLSPPRGGPLKLRITALTGEPPLTPLAAPALFSPQAGSDDRSRHALNFLAYEEKFLAGSWRFDTYFGRDTLMSLRLLLPALQPAAVEDGIASVLARLAANGEVAHEEDIGEFAILRRRGTVGSGVEADQRDAPADAPVFDYVMVDDDLMLAPVAAAWLLDDPRAKARAAAFLAQPGPGGEAHGAALARNFAFVLAQAAPFVDAPSAKTLVALKPGKPVGQWRDSNDGLAGGRVAWDVNAVLMPAALEAIARFADSGLFDAHATPAQRAAFAGARAAADAWTRDAPPLFDVALDAGTARAAVAAHAKREGIDAAEALASVPADGLAFDAIALDAAGRPIPVLHSDGGFALLFQRPSPERLDAMVAAMLRPYPAGLLTGIGLLVANPAFAGDAVAAKFGRNAYHGAVVWSWQQAMLAAGLARQLERDDLPPATRARLVDARQRLWTAIDATQALRTSELWSWSHDDGRYALVPFGQGRGDADESNAAQLWSTVYLAIPRPGDAAPATPPADAAVPAPAPAATSTGMPADGAMPIPAFTVPFSDYASPQALARFREVLAESARAPGLGTDGIAAARAFYDGINSDRVRRMRALFDVETTTGTIAGVDVDIVEPAAGAPRNRGRVLLNLHGGAFLWGAHSGALVEAIPVAAESGIRVIGVDYRQGPEHVFPAATDDVVAVYRDLLQRHRAGDIGIYGCSAGAALTGQVVARLHRDGLPLPGAVAMGCGGIVARGGDSAWVAPALSGDPVGSGPVSLVKRLPYFRGASEDDPLVIPANDPALLRAFPPTLLVSGTRDFAMSGVLQSHRLLVEAGVEADLHVWDGMWHAFFSDPELPESREAYRVFARFFDRRLGR